MQIPSFKQINSSVLLILLGGLLLRSIIAFWLYPGFDEAYYYLYSQHLDWSYFDHPLLVSLTTGFGIWLTQIISPFTIRLGSLLLYTASLWLLYSTGCKLFNPQAGKLTLIIASIVPIFSLAFGVLTLPDVPLIFFWSASLYCSVSEFFNNLTYRPSYRLALLGVFLGLACLSKYHGFILALGLIGFTLTIPVYRQAWLSPWGWLGVGLFFLTLAPILIWNWQHDWVSFRFQLSSRFIPNSGEAPAQFNLLKMLLVFFAGIGYLFPTMGFPLWWVTVKTLWEEIWRREIKDTKYLLIFWLSLPLVIGFLLIGAKEQILPTWQMPGFWVLSLLLGQEAVFWQEQHPLFVRRWLKGSAITVISLLLFVLLHVTTGTLQKQGKYALFGGLIAPENDSSTELIDINQLRQGFQQSPELRKALEESSFIFTNAYYLGGLIDMALRPILPIPVTCFSNDMRGFAFWYDSVEWLGKDGLYITLKRFHDFSKITDEYRQYFRSLKIIGKVPIHRGGAVVETFYIYKAAELLKEYPRKILKNH